MKKVFNRPGYDALWLQFGLSRASWLTLPRVLMHEMPDKWQAKMAKLLDEMDEAFPNYPDITHHVVSKKNGQYIKTPDYLQNYRYPDKSAVERMKGKPTTPPKD